MPPLGRVLVVDDEPLVAELLRDALTDFGYEVATAATARDALTMALLYRPDVVLLDLVMPGMSGEVALERFQLFDPTLPIVVVSGNQDEDLARETLTKGAFDYIKKPFDLPVLERVLAGSILERDRCSGRSARYPRSLPAVMRPGTISSMKAFRTRLTIASQVFALGFSSGPSMGTTLGMSLSSRFGRNLLNRFSAFSLIFCPIPFRPCSAPDTFKSWIRGLT
jgi:DNA-binding NtrC family response regulator